MCNNYVLPSTFLMTAKIVSYMIILQNIIVFIIGLNSVDNIVMVNLNNYKYSNKLLLDPELNESNIMRFTNNFTNIIYKSNVFIPIFYKNDSDTLYNNIITYPTYCCNMSDDLMNCMADTITHSDKDIFTSYINDGYKYWDCYHKKINSNHYKCVKSFLDITYNKTKSIQVYKMLSINSIYSNSNNKFGNRTLNFINKLFIMFSNRTLNFINKLFIICIVTILELCGSYIMLFTFYLVYKIVMITYTFINNNLIRTQYYYKNTNTLINTNDKHIKNERYTQ
jgi:hypothetical protein